MPFGQRLCSPRSTSLTNQEVSSSPGGSGNRGIRSAPSVKDTSHCSAISSVLSQAEASSPVNSARISAALFR